MKNFRCTNDRGSHLISPWNFLRIELQMMFLAVLHGELYFHLKASENCLFFMLVYVNDADDEFS